jgi:hypothetical protein
MTDRERAVQYIGIFIGLGDDWEYCAPVDGERTPDGLRLGSVEIGPDENRPGVWWLDDGTTRRHYQKAVEREGADQ